jgi:transcription antitermination factor NusG
MTAVAAMDVVRDLAAAPPPEREYTGFPWWHALIVPPNREELSAERLARVNVQVYLPTYISQVRLRGRCARRRLFAVIPGMLFVPVEIVDIARRAQVFEFANVHGFVTIGRQPARIAKADIEIIREIEAKLNTPLPRMRATAFKVGQRVRFTSALYAAFLGEAVVEEVVSPTRIGVAVQRLFGRTVRVYVPESEIEVDVT